MKLLVFGHSHVWALRRSLQADVPAIAPGGPDIVVALCGTQEFPAGLVYTDQSNRTAINSALLSGLHRVGGVPAEDVLVSCVQGNQYNSIGLLNDGVMFDLHPPGWPRPPVLGVELVPYRAMYWTLGELWDEFRQFVPRLKTLKYRGIMHMCAPPPVSDNSFIAAAIPQLPKCTVADIAPPDVRLKLWTMQRDITREIVVKAGAVFLDPPEETLDKDGFLAETFWKDSVHSNAAYGKIALEQAAASAAVFASQQGA